MSVQTYEGFSSRNRWLSRFQTRILRILGMYTVLRTTCTNCKLSSLTPRFLPWKIEMGPKQEVAGGDTCKPGSVTDKAVHAKLSSSLKQVLHLLTSWYPPRPHPHFSLCSCFSTPYFSNEKFSLFFGPFLFTFFNLIFSFRLDGQISSRPVWALVLKVVCMWISIFKRTYFTPTTYSSQPRAHTHSWWWLLKLSLLEHIELPAKLLDYFLRSNKSNINQ